MGFYYGDLPLNYQGRTVQREDGVIVRAYDNPERLI